MKAVSTLAVLAAAGMAASAGAGVRTSDLSVKSLGTSNPVLRAGYSTGFEAAEGYGQGIISGQQGWIVNNISATNTAKRQKQEVRNGVNFGNGSANALVLSKSGLSATLQPQGNLGIAQSPTSMPASSFSGDSWLSTLDTNANYGGLGFDSGAGLLTWRVEFNYAASNGGDGHIYYVDTNANAGAGAFIDTGVSWVATSYKTVTVNINAGTIDYFYGGSLIATQIGLNGGGATYDTVQLYHDNYEISGESFRWDNINFTVPAPSAAGLLGLGGLAAARRRRA